MSFRLQALEKCPLKRQVVAADLGPVCHGSLNYAELGIIDLMPSNG